jgi:hypothetical protein
LTDIDIRWVGNSDIQLKNGRLSTPNGTGLIDVVGTGLIDVVVGLVKETIATNATTSASATIGAGLQMLQVWGPSIISAVIIALVIKSTVPPVVVWSREQAERQLAFDRSVQRVRTVNIWRYVSSILYSYRYFLVGSL